MKDNNKYVWPSLVLSGILVYLFLPLAATFLFSVAKDWQATILPESYTWGWYERLFQDANFFNALWRSLMISFISTAFGMVIIIPAVVITLYYFPKLDSVLRIFSSLPFAFPPVIMAVGLIELYGHKPFALTGTIWILLGSYFVVVLPYIYQATANSFRSIDAVTLVAAAESLGASKVQAFLYVILPNVFPGLLVAFLLSFSVLFGEFVLANLLVGSGYQTLQLYLYKMSWENGHLASAIVAMYYLFMLLITMAMLLLKKTETKGKIQKPLQDEGVLTS